MALEIYDQVFPYLNGGLISDSTQVSTELRSDVQAISTIVKDLAGFTPSPIMREVTVDGVIPIGGIEYEIERIFIRRQFSRMKLLLGGSGQSYEGDGFFTSVKIDSGVGKTTTLSFTWIGEAKEFA
jgi:hypothetical protein